jgi:hypothetical protein
MIYIKLLLNLIYFIIFFKGRYNKLNKIKIDGKEYSYFLERKHAYLFTKIIGKLDININPETKTFNEIILIIQMVQSSLLNFETTEKETLDFISSIYKLKPEEVEKAGFMFELKLWENLFRDEELVSFFSHVFKSKMKEKAVQKKESQKKKS